MSRSSIYTKESFADLMGNTQRYYKTDSVLLPTCTAAKAVKKDVQVLKTDVAL
jgi:hypothetical protein